MLRTALRNVLAHKARLVMTALAVLLGVAFVAGTLVFGSTMGEAFKNQSAKNLKDVAVSVQQDYTSISDREDDEADDRKTTLDGALADRIAKVPGVASVRPMVSGNATIAKKGGGPVNGVDSWQNFAANYVPGKDGKDSRYPLKDGRGPAAADEIALDARTADEAGYRIGDTVRFATEGPTLTKKLVGTVTTEDPAVTAGGTLALFDTAAAQKLFLSPGYFDEIVVSAKLGTDQQALTAKVSDVLPKEGAKAVSGKQLADEQAEQIARDTSALTKTLLVFAGIALFVGVFIIANTFTMLIAQRSREIALIRAVGASRRQVVRSVLIEAGLLGLAASTVGFGLGLAIAAGMRPLLNASGAGLPDGPLVIGADAVLASLAVGVLVTVLAAWLPSRKAAKIAPVEALSSVDGTPAARSMVVRNVIGALLTAAGVTVMLYVTTLDGSEGLGPAMLGSALTLTGMIVLAPLLSRPLVSLAGQVTGRLFGVSGKLAKENALRNPRRTAATASALMIGLTLITALTVAGNSAQAGIDKMATEGLRADYKVAQTNNQLPDNAAPKLDKVPGVAAAAPIRTVGFTTTGGYHSMTGTDLDAFAKTIDLKFRSGSLADLGDGRIGVSRQTAEKQGWSTGDTVEFEFYDGKEKKRTFQIAGVYEGSDYAGEVLGTTEDVKPHAFNDSLDSVLVKADGGATAGLGQKLRDALGDSPLLTVQNHEQLKQESAGVINTILYLMYGLLGMAVVIAVLGVVNTLAMSVFERTREIGMLRAIGLDRTGVKQMVRLESVVISLFGAVLGIGVGIFLAWAGGSLTGSSFATYEMVLPWGRLGLFLLIALVVGVLAAIWPARRAARLNVLAAISAQ
ncbi:ABC transporter permease [Streptomyces apocyni]|uniref:ABC transporter permease n=1 Tax=Streptomyces apocyni TaxID=2654677 RepID=UPI0012EA2BF3|nr:FtsX-like permease family protein [Streptomyces apocyni]